MPADDDKGPGPATPPAGTSVRLWVLGSLLAIMVAFSGLTVYSIVLYRRTVAEIGLINSTYLPLTHGTAKIRSTQLVFSTLLDRLLDDPNTSITRSWIDAARRMRPSTLRELSDLARDTVSDDIPEQEARYLLEIAGRLSEVKDRYLENEAKFHEVYSLMDTGRLDEAQVQLEGLKRTERLLDGVLNGIGREVRRHITELAERAERDGVRATLGLALLTLAALIIGVVALLSTQRLLAPLRALQQAVARVARGELQTRIDVARGDEIGALAAGFNRMTAALAERDEMLIRSERLATTGKMAAQVTHEIRNPLSSLGLNAELLEEELAGDGSPAEARALLAAMQDEVERLTGITESYLRFARLPAAEPAVGNLNDEVQAALDFMRGEMDELGITLEARLDRDLEPALFDPGQLRQALVNLLRNAGEAMPEGGTVRVGTRVAGDTVEIEVVDEGPGIPEASLEHIFESFYTTKSGGTGLGLPLVKQICLAHGGDVRCSETGERGTTFVIALPRVPTTSRPAQEKEP